MNVGFKTASQPECSVGIKMDVTCETSELNFYLLSINLICFNHHNDGFPCSQCDKSLLNYSCFSSLNRPKIPELPILSAPPAHRTSGLTGQRSTRPILLLTHRTTIRSALLQIGKLISYHLRNVSMVIFFSIIKKFPNFYSVLR